MNSRWILVCVFATLLLTFFASGQTPGTSPMPQTDTAPHLVVQLGILGGVGLVALSDRSERLSLGDRDWKQTSHVRGTWKGIPSAAYSNDGKLVATGSWDSTARIWSAADGQLLRELKEPKAPVISVAFSLDSKLLAVGNSDKAVRVFEAETGHTLKTINTKSYPLSVSFSPDSRYLLTASKYPDEKKVHLWEIKTGSEVRSFTGANRAVLSADGKYAFVAGPNDLGAPATLWLTETGELVRRFEGYSTGASDVAVSSDSNYLVTLGGGGSCHLWNLESGTVQSIKEGFAENDGRSFIINSAVFTPDGKSLVTAERDDILTNRGGGIQFWDVETGNKTRRIGAGGVGPVALSSDGKFAITGKGDV